MRANAVGKKCSEVEKAYIAGFLDADGAIMAFIEPHREKRFGFCVRVPAGLALGDLVSREWNLCD